jgi:hypothetical protein
MSQAVGARNDLYHSPRRNIRKFPSSKIPRVPVYHDTSATSPPICFHPHQVLSPPRSQLISPRILLPIRRIPLLPPLPISAINLMHTLLSLPLPLRSPLIAALLLWWILIQIRHRIIMGCLIPCRRHRARNLRSRSRCGRRRRSRMHVRRRRRGLRTNIPLADFLPCDADHGCFFLDGGYVALSRIEGCIALLCWRRAEGSVGGVGGWCHGWTSLGMERGVRGWGWDVDWRRALSAAKKQDDGDEEKDAEGASDGDAGFGGGGHAR